LPAAAEDVFRLLARGLLGDGAQVLIEQPTRASVLVPPGSGFVQVGKRSWGDTQVGWYAREMARFP
jgi:hypothetical protein